MSADGWRVGDRSLKRTQLPLLMGILNVTPDSFSDGGDHDHADAAVSHALQLIEDGADIIDIGGESTRPGATPVSEAEELRRTIPVIAALSSRTQIPISIDTTKAVVAEAAIDAGAAIVNDISGMTFDSRMLPLCAKRDVAVCVMHIRGTPQTMQQDPQYDDVVTAVRDFLKQRLAECSAAGIAFDRVCLDPGIGFGKTAEHNLQLMRAIPWLKAELNRPLLIGHSRKRFLSKLLGRPVEERLSGTVGVSVALASLGADLLRIHDVRATRDALVAWHAVAGT
ncbi:MAG: dihydropteroate synthase [Planctomycetaceae bacterium]